MEKLQPESGNQSQMRTGPQILATTIAGIALSACVTIVPKHEPRHEHRYESQPREIPYELPPVRLMNKTHTYNGPLGDPICTYIYNNQTQVRELCNPKPSIVLDRQSYSRTIQVPQTRIVLPIYGMRINQYTKQLESYIITPQRIENIPGRYTPRKQVCTPTIPFSQIDGSQLPIREICN